MAIFGNFTVLERLIEPENAALTVANITESLGAFRLGIAAFLMVFAIDVLVAWALHVVFRAVDRDLSLLTAWFRLVYAVFLGAGLVSLLEVVQLVGGDAGVATLSTGQIEAQGRLVLGGPLEACGGSARSAA
jgi:hypothetical protein